MFYDPLPHQIEDSDALLEYAHGLLWADPGTGKTVTAMESFRKGGFQKAIVVCPKSAVTMWKEEMEKHLSTPEKPFKVFVVRSSRLPKGVNIHDYDAIVVTFGVARTLCTASDDRAVLFVSFQLGGTSDKVSSWRGWDNKYITACIVDEAHNLKNADAGQTKAVFGMDASGRKSCVVAHVDSVWQLTGTPIMRFFDDAWSQLRFARPEILEHYDVLTRKKFIEKFCMTKPNPHSYRHEMVVCGNKNHTLFRELLDACRAIRRRLEDVVDDLPPITHVVYDVDYAKKGLSIGKYTIAQLVKSLNDPDSEGAKTRRMLGLAKVPGVLTHLNEVCEGPTLLGFWHREVGDAYEVALRKSGYSVVQVTGDVGTDERDLIRERFNAGKIDVLIGQMQAMNASWNLQDRCQRVVIAEELPSPGLLKQFYSRVYRRGQQNHVNVDHMLTNHDIDHGLRYVRLGKDADNIKAGL